jgi:16S rRNA (cytidine1402-2'-O)-methyltransferase
MTPSGLPTGRFHFLGFLPRGGPERREMLAEVAPLSATLVLYESPRRLGGATLAELAEVLGGARRACVARELTKRHEEFVRDSLEALAARYAEAEPLLPTCVRIQSGPQLL